jgi:crotonobetainyl-CoA:carnitine CoA-transferase CaiB-like acyl-CoA transferase
MIGAAGILAALLRRERTGEGAYVEAALAEAALPFALYNWAEALMTGAHGGEGSLTGGLACYRIYPTRDDKYVALGALEPKFWENFCSAVERPDLIDHYLDPTRQAYLRVELGGIFAMRTLAEWDLALGGVDCCFSVVNNPAQVSSDPHFAARGMLGRFADGTPWMRSPIRISDSTPTIQNDVPGYGADTRAVLSQAGYSAAAIEELLTNGIVAEKA